MENNLGAEQVRPRTCSQYAEAVSRLRTQGQQTPRHCACEMVGQQQGYPAGPPGAAAAAAPYITQ